MLDENFATNHAELAGTAMGPSVYSHESRGIRFSTFPLETRRLSGTPDTVNILLREPAQVVPGDRLWLEGELRSWNNKTGVGNRLVLTVLARELRPWDGPEDRIQLTGAVCREPTYRVTPMGREICDVILAVSRRYRRSDYIPVIAWGLQARQVAEAPVGALLTVRGRLQSREYSKVIDGESQKRTAFEVSAADIVAL